MDKGGERSEGSEAHRIVEERKGENGEGNKESGK